MCTSGYAGSTAAPGLPLPWQQQLSHFKYQYLQLQGTLKYPEPQCLKNEEFQEALFTEMFAEDAVKYHPPARYQLRVLKELVRRIEESISDWEEEQSISDNLMNLFSTVLITGIPSEAEAAQQKSYVTYTLTSLTAPPSNASRYPRPPIITAYSTQSLLGQSGTTGFRTWEASLHLSTYLCSLSATHTHSPTARKILELGSGTGFLTILCAGHLQAAHITATDGFTHVLNDLRSNLALNDLEDSTKITVRQLKWGEDLRDHAKTDGEPPDGQVDLIIGADVTYDAAALPALTSTIADLMTLYPNAQILLASTVRNPETYAKFIRLCGERSWKVKDVDWPIQGPEEQTGPFYALDKGMEARICEILRYGEQEDKTD